MDVIVGTAGHIDHGKTALVKALTGTDTDRLPEEKLRGITIDLGFAELQSDDVHIGFVDVPGHERFVKNMLAGAGGIDLVLLVIAADEGVMPQTREHFDICRLLRIGGGVIVLTKSDLADPDTLELAKLETADLVKNSLLENAPVFSVSSRTGEGITELRDALVRAAKGVHRENDVHEARLPIDRSFSVKGFGAVVTGTLASGEIAEGEELELLPGGQKLRVRGIQTHGSVTRVARVGQRTAVNIAGIGHDEITRGMTLSAPGALSITQVFDAWVEVLADAPRGLKSRQRFRIHLGTAEVLARIAVLNDAQTIAPGGDGHVQFRLESPVASTHGDRFIVRTYSPQRTIAGGCVLDPVAPRHRRRDLINVLPELRQLAEAVDGGDHPVQIFVRMAGERGVRSSGLRSRTGLRSDVLDALIETAKLKGEIVDANGVLVSKAMFEGLKVKTLAAVEAHHRADKLARGVPRETLRERVFKHSDADLFRAVTGTLERDGKIVFDQDVFKLASHETQLTPAETIARDELRMTYIGAGLAPPKLDDALREASIKSALDQKAARKVFQLLVNSGELISITPEFYFRTDVVNALTENVREMARVSGDPMIDVAKFKEIAGVSRKYAIPLLEYFDRSRVTRRVGDKRQIL
ncbi:MAG: selenocysteine-specific translation elongation factor [Blastocatellia bacterium]|nr:selenocysteine-specific translation elongation factor [Blastocatellia bacterium]